MTGTIEKDPRYHPAFQRGYTGPPPERRAREEERFRRPRGSARATTALADPTHSRLERTPAPALVPEPLDPAVALGFDAAQELQTSAPTGEESAEESPRPALLDPAAGRRVTRTLALIGVVLLAVGLLALWFSSQGWFNYSESADAFGTEQYLRTLSQLVASPALTVGLIVLCSSALVPLVQATRR